MVFDFSVCCVRRQHSYAFCKGLTETELETCVARSGIKVLFYDKRFQNVVDHIKAQHGDKVDFICMAGEGSLSQTIMEEGRKALDAGENRYLSKKSARKILPYFYLPQALPAIPR